MKNIIMTVLWIMYSLLFGWGITFLEGKEPFIEKFGVGLLIGQVVLFIYMIVTMVINASLCSLNFRIKLHSSKFISKVTPIYRVFDWEDSYVSVSKWELQWVDFELDSYRFALLPFCVIFQRYRYVKATTYDFEIPLLNIVDAELLYESKFAEEQLKKKIKETEEERNITALDKLNRVFKENYEV